MNTYFTDMGTNELHRALGYLDMKMNMGMDKQASEDARQRTMILAALRSRSTQAPSIINKSRTDNEKHGQRSIWKDSI